MSRPGVSIVVEWDNVHLAGASRARAMTSRLVSELASTSGHAFEVLLVHDGRPGDALEAQRMLVPTGVDVRIVSAPGSDYYELKNVGASEARGDLVVFLDCDVVPEPGWLGEMLAPFADPRVDAVAGAPYIEPTGLLGKSYALAWIFDLRPDWGGVARTERFFANSLAFRRETALAFPFPKVAGTARAACVALSRRLADAGVVVVRNSAARGGHPAPPGFRSLVGSAFAHGRDTVLLHEAGIGSRAGARAGLRRCTEAIRDVVRDRRRVGLRPAEVPLAIAIGVGYYGVAAAGALSARAVRR